MVEPNQRRAHGQTAGEDEAHEKAKDLDKPVELEVDKPLSLTRAFQRLRTDWNSKDRDTMEQVKSTVENFIFEQFEDAFRIEYEILDVVREKEIDPATGEVKVDEFGLAVWKRRPDGSYYENWSNIGHAEREKLLYEIVVRLFNWEQKVADIRGEALFAKAIWEEAFATGFDTASNEKKTVEARNAVGTRVSMDHRYLAVYKSYALDKAQAIVKSMDRVCQRLKDLHI